MVICRHWLMGTGRMEGAQAGAAVLSTKQVLISPKGSVEPASRIALTSNHLPDKEKVQKKNPQKKPKQNKTTFPENCFRTTQGKQGLAMSALPFSMTARMHAESTGWAINEGPPESQTLGLLN